MSTIWLAYVEQHALTDPYRRDAGRARRLSGIPDAVLPDPADVVGWLTNRRATFAKLADEHGAAFDALVDDHESVNTRLTAAGSSVYATVRQTATTAVDLCVEAFVARDCTSRQGHQFTVRPNGTWRCTQCDQVL